jgi:hypothetical protein
MRDREKQCQAHYKMFLCLSTVDLLHHPPCPPIGPAHDKCVASRQEEVTEYSTESSSAESSSSAGLENGGSVPSGLSRFQWFMLVNDVKRNSRTS